MEYLAPLMENFVAGKKMKNCFTFIDKKVKIRLERQNRFLAMEGSVDSVK